MNGITKSSVVDASDFLNCNCLHQLEMRASKVKEQIMEAHLEVKNQLIHNLEDIIDEQEARIRSMDDYINGRTDTIDPWKKKILKGISLLSLDFGSLSEENLALKESIVKTQRALWLLQNQIREQKISSAKIVVNASCQTDDSYISEIIRKNNNNNFSNKDKELANGLRKNLGNIREARKSLKILKTEITGSINRQVQEVHSDITKICSEYVGALIDRYRKEVDLRKKLHNKLVEINGNIRVFCRIRPLRDTSLYDKKYTRIDSIDNSYIISENQCGEIKRYFCDKAFDERFTQSDIFEEVIPVITSCLDGYNVCIFAYGHTGSGKTYTMEGPSNDPGINQRSIFHLFRLADERLKDFSYAISLSILEIYNEKIRDLLSDSKNNLSVRIGNSGKLEIPGLTSVVVHSVEDVQKVLARGSSNRVFAVTDLNDRSSRSHFIVQVSVKTINRTTNVSAESTLNLVDLAGSERVSQSGATGQQLKEAQCINRSLSELGNVVNALRQRQQHIPFRNCQLTRLLENCLNGDSKTLMIVQLSPEQINLQESISTLNFAEKVSSIQMKSPINSSSCPTNSSSLKVVRLKSESNFIRSNSVRGTRKIRN